MDLADFQNRNKATYGAKDADRGVDGTFMYFIEEVGELAEALREDDRAALEGEFADCLAWLVSLANLADVDLAAVTDRKYPLVCRTCGKQPCACATKP